MNQDQQNRALTAGFLAALAVLQEEHVVTEFERDWLKSDRIRTALRELGEIKGAAQAFGCTDLENLCQSDGARLTREAFICWHKMFGEIIDPQKTDPAPEHGTRHPEQLNADGPRRVTAGFGRSVTPQASASEDTDAG